MAKVWKVLRLWPLVAIAFSLPFHFAPALNADLVIMPLLTKGGMRFLHVLMIGSFISFADLGLGFMAWGGLADLIKNFSHKDPLFEAKVLGTVRPDGWRDRIKILFTRMHRKLSDENSKIFQKIKKGGLVALFALGVNPLMGTRLPADVICGTLKWGRGFAVLAIGNFLKNLGYALAAHGFFS